MTENGKRKLAQLLGMIGSHHDGEVLNAARLAQRELKAMGLTWDELLNSSAATVGGAANRAAGGGRWDLDVVIKDKIDAAYKRGFAAGVKSRDVKLTWKQWAKARLLEDEDCLSAWEVTFFGSFADGRRGEPSEKQHAIFERVSERLGIELPE